MSKPGRNALGGKEVNDEQRRASGVVLFCIVEIRVMYIMEVEAAGRPVGREGVCRKRGQCLRNQQCLGLA